MWMKGVEFCEKVAKEGLLKKWLEWRLEGRGMKKKVVGVWGTSMSEEMEKDEFWCGVSLGLENWLFSWGSVGKKEKKK